MLIVIEGVDGSGKETQTRLLHGRFPDALKIEFPDYESDSSALIKMYLGGQFGSEPLDVSPYAASVFFACDRYASYKVKWENFLKNGGMVIADRYVTSNLIHQMCKIEDRAERQKFMDWLDDFEYNIMGVPRPDFTVFLDMPVECARKLMKERNNKITGNNQKDIHESNVEYMQRAYKNALDISSVMGWHRISCADGDRIKTPEDISQEVYEAVTKYMRG